MTDLECTWNGSSCAPRLRIIDNCATFSENSCMVKGLSDGEMVHNECVEDSLQGFVAWNHRVGVPGSRPFGLVES